MRHIPNILSCIRIAMTIAFIVLFIKQQYTACLILFIASFLTDVLDGYLARRNNWISDFGKLVDPFADKFMFISVLICLVCKGVFPVYLLIILVVKELLLIVGGLIILKKKHVSVYSDIWGKLATGLFFVAFTLALAKLAFASFIPDWLLTVLFITALTISVLSLFHYAYMSGFIGKKYRDHSAYETDTPQE